MQRTCDPSAATATAEHTRLTRFAATSTADRVHRPTAQAGAKVPTTRSWPTTKRREAAKVLLKTSWPTSREAKVPLTTSSVADNQTPGGAKVPTTAPL